ncbi:mRNA (guanine-N7-)-methyltransferase [Nematocida minor]|uniref:mRNA (guanine-N7-)-methyltransferase n=1 Tax=Nematocida minor TaxID=1912983 RepID=UPI002220B73C|nr:mRNA (guanine-N7-)-methyltransferase [Nematocida minor]KAI5192708.1 mRNA (guanine-N7-)-methyltransferase [Nematocida minor]
MPEVNRVAEHYNNIKSLGIEGRKVSEIIAVREVNNFIKLKLIEKYIQKNHTVFDMGCGKGGDLSKLKYANIKKYYGCDIAEDSLKEALERSLSHRFKINLMNADFTKDKIVLEDKVDLAMSQFSFHYSFVDEVSVRKAVMNVCNNLKKGGVFIMTVPDKNVIIRRSDRNTVDGSFGNKYHKITINSSFKTNKLFGRGYNFFLHEAVTGCEEYLTDIEYLTDLFREKGLVKILDTDFLSFLNSEMNNDPATYKRMVKNTLSKEEVPIIELYRAVAFRKEA